MSLLLQISYSFLHIYHTPLSDFSLKLIFMPFTQILFHAIINQLPFNQQQFFLIPLHHQLPINFFGVLQFLLTFYQFIHLANIFHREDDSSLESALRFPFLIYLSLHPPISIDLREPIFQAAFHFQDAHLYRLALVFELRF